MQLTERSTAGISWQEITIITRLISPRYMTHRKSRGRGKFRIMSFFRFDRILMTSHPQLLLKFQPFFLKIVHVNKSAHEYEDVWRCFTKLTQSIFHCLQCRQLKTTANYSTIITIFCRYYLSARLASTRQDSLVRPRHFRTQKTEY